MKAVFSLLTAVLLAAFFSYSPAEGCWVGFSTGELVEQADLIVIGDIKGISGTEKAEGMWQTRWEVEAQYFLKGNADNALLIVATPGAKGKQPFVSTYYQLNYWGDTVLLFLAKRKAYFEPLSLQWVVALSPVDSPPPSAVALNQNAPPSPNEVALNQNDPLQQNQLNGEDLLKKYNITNEKTPEEYKKELENYITGLPRVAAATPEIDILQSGIPRSCRIKFPVFAERLLQRLVADYAARKKTELGYHVSFVGLGEV